MTKTHSSKGKGHGSASKVPAKIQQQRDSAEQIEIEQRAREAAEKLLTPAERATANEPEAARQPLPEPTLEQRLADIDRRAKQRVIEEKAALAGHYLLEARAKFKKAISATTDDDLKKAFEDVQRLERLAGDDSPRTSLEGHLDDGKRFGMGKNGETPTARVRRSPDDLKADAAKLVDWLKAHPNSKGSAVTEATGVTIKPPLNLKTFVEKYGDGVKVTTEGQKAGTTYSIG